MKIAYRIIFEHNNLNVQLRPTYNLQLKSHIVPISHSLLPPVIISRLILIQRDMKWKVYVSDHFLLTENNETLAEFDSIMTSEIILPLIYALNDAFHALEMLTFRFFN